MDRIQTLEMFVAVADQGSFSAAAKAFRVSPPTVTRGIGALESRLGVSLFHRSTRAVSLTDDGAAFLPRARRILADIQDAERQVSGARTEPRGQFYVTAPVMFGRLHVLPVIGTMMEQHEQLDIRMMFVDRNVRIVEEGIDVAVRIGKLADSSLLAIPIGFVRQKLVASPAYLARTSQISTAPAAQYRRLCDCGCGSGNGDSKFAQLPSGGIHPAGQID